MLREKQEKSVHHKISEEKLEQLASTHRLNKNQEASIDEDLLFNTDSDDSFTMDYTIPKQTLRKERILKRDEARFEIEKKRRAEERVIKLAQEKEQKELEDRLAKEEAERLQQEEEQAEKEREELQTYRSKNAEIDGKRKVEYDESKQSARFRDEIEP